MWSPSSWVERFGVATAVAFLVMAILIIAMVIAAYGGYSQAYAQGSAQGSPQRTVCRDRPGGTTGVQWSWRSQVDGRAERCWYAGERMRDRGLLYWVMDPAKPQGGVPDLVLLDV